MPDEPVTLTAQETVLDRRLDAWGRNRISAVEPHPGAGRAFVGAARVRGRLVLARRVAVGALAASVLLGVGVALWFGGSRAVPTSAPAAPEVVLTRPAPTPTVIELTALNRQAEPPALTLAERPRQPVATVTPPPPSEMPRAGNRADHAVAKGF